MPIFVALFWRQNVIILLKDMMALEGSGRHLLFVLCTGKLVVSCWSHGVVNSIHLDSSSERDLVGGYNILIKQAM